MTREPLELKLSDGQRGTLLKYADLPDRLAERLGAKVAGEAVLRFTLDELDELLDHVEEAVYRAKGNEKQKALRIVARVSKLLGSTIDPAEMPGSRRPHKAETVFQLKVTLNNVRPPVWRRIQTKDCTLEKLHALIQVAMGWEFDHPYRFVIGGVKYVDLDTMNDGEAEDACATELGDVLPIRNLRPRFLYEYDFGDEWIHQVIVEERFPPEHGVRYPRCVGGERACPPEDCGGPWDYADFVEAVQNPDHERHEELLEWMGGDFDPEAFDIEAVNRRLAKVR
jgi:hypothetical protein